ncbi:TonB family protein [Bacteroides sp. UBA939]|uniref:TonB family protein n=1 Tax=Bacteroides sp. UBA939 TaxID=1946092 RepID=UPI0025C1C715|nr:TonB family protein [Bacteroides sp. UBA939]
MKHGKQTCRILKEIRKEIAKANDIEFIVSECQHKGDCAGTCPKCEAEVRYLEQQLNRRRLLGKAVTVVEVSMGLSMLTACSNQQKQKDNSVDEKIDSFGILVEVPMTGYSDTIPEKIVNDTVSAVTIGYIPPNPADTLPSADGIYLVTEEMPEFPGGMTALMEFLNETTRYPKHVKEKIEGRAVVQFVVQKDGSATRAKVLRSLGPVFDKEALRVVSLFPKWKPGKHRGKVVPVRYTVPVMFRIPEHIVPEK